MNYIKHLTGFFDKVVQDDRLNPTHISLYLALFQFWNLQRFKNPFSISREEVMRLSKIASKATYHKCMRELHAFQFLEYNPSYNPYRGSLITIFNLELTHEHVQKSVRKHTKKQPSPELVPEQVGEQVIEPINEPYINVNKQNKTKETLLNIVRGDLEIEQAKSEEIINFSKKGNLNKNGQPKKAKSKPAIPPPQDEVKKFFIEQKFTELESEKFFNHFESNGWLVGGKTPMKNWQAAARNWMINSEKFRSNSKSNGSSNLSKNHLHVNQDKDYNIPL